MSFPTDLRSGPDWSGNPAWFPVAPLRKPSEPDPGAAALAFAFAAWDLPPRPLPFPFPISDSEFLPGVGGFHTVGRSWP